MCLVSLSCKINLNSWYIGYSRHMTCIQTFYFKNGGDVTFGDGARDKNLGIGRLNISILPKL